MFLVKSKHIQKGKGKCLIRAQEHAICNIFW